MDSNTHHSEIFSRYHIEPKKALGQNFLTNEEILSQIATAVDLSGRNVIEVGPGYGALTTHILSQSPASLTLVEYDTSMIRILEDRLKRGEFTSPWVDFLIHHGDVLQFTPTRPSVIVANIPYYITSPILFRFLYEVLPVAEEMVILMQKEVADKIRKTHKNKSSYLSLFCERKCSSITEVTRVAPLNFSPPPKVESSVLHFVARPDTQETLLTDKAFLKLTSLGFSHPRKLLAGNLSSTGKYDRRDVEWVFESIWVSKLARPEDLGLEDWTKLLTRL